MNRTEVVTLVRDLIAGRDPKPPTLELAEQRRQAAAEIVAIEAEREKTLPKLAAAESKARDAWEASKRAEHGARERYASAMGAAMGARHGFDRRLSERESFLRKTADPAIEAFVRELRDELEQTRKEPPTVTTETKWSPLRGSHTIETSSRPAQVARLERIREAIRAAEGLRLAADVDVTAELQKIKAAIDGEVSGE